jgi:alkylhydroperoxidase/carboxymuconolactone decarboxylase family protein YurZ
MKNKLDLELEGQNGNAFALLGYFSKEAKKAGWTAEEIKEVFDKATVGDYNHLLNTLMEV